MGQAYSLTYCSVTVVNFLSVQFAGNDVLFVIFHQRLKLLPVQIWLLSLIFILNICLPVIVLDIRGQNECNDSETEPEILKSLIPEDRTATPNCMCLVTLLVQS